MKSFLRRIAALTLAGAVGVSAASAKTRAVQPDTAVSEIREEQRIHTSAQNSMFSVLGLGFICAGGLVSLIVLKNRT